MLNRAKIVELCSVPTGSFLALFHAQVIGSEWEAWIIILSRMPADKTDSLLIKLTLVQQNWPRPGLGSPARRRQMRLHEAEREDGQKRGIRTMCRETATNDTTEHSSAASTWGLHHLYVLSN